MVNYLNYLHSIKEVILINEEEYVETTWTSVNKKYYIDKGYFYTHTRDKFMVKIKDLPDKSKVPINCICDYCGKSFITNKNSLSRFSKNNIHSCCQCKSHKMSRTRISNNCKNIMSQARQVCDELGYILLSKDTDYHGLKSKVYYLCPKHGKQSSTFNNFIHGHGCKQCGHERTVGSQRNTPEKISRVISSVNNNKLINPEEYINSSTQNLKILCGCCNKNIFITSFGNYKNSTQRCLECTNSISKNELRIKRFLDDNNIIYIQEKTFPDCKDKGLLFFDFYLPDYCMCIEFDGEQHYNPNYDITLGVENPDLVFETRQKHDVMKDEYCKKNNIHMLRIPYWEENHIEEIIKKELDNLSKRNSLIS